MLENWNSLRKNKIEDFPLKKVSLIADLFLFNRLEKGQIRSL